MSGEVEVLDATADPAAWRATLDRFDEVDPCQTAEYTRAYASQRPGAAGRLFVYREAAAGFALANLVTPVEIAPPDAAPVPTDAVDLETPHGYGGPLATSRDAAFLGRAWRAYDAWAAEIGAIAEFTRFSVLLCNHGLAHPQAEVLRNREVALVAEVADGEELLRVLNQKSRNLIRKAQKSGLTARQVDRRDHLADFRRVYGETMSRNAAAAAFLFDDAYWAALEALPDAAFRMIGAFAGEEMVGGVVALAEGSFAAYHLAAALAEPARLGAGNLLAFTFNETMLAAGARRILLGGGRSDDPEDALLRFKRKNATVSADYHIGLRVLDQARYDDVKETYRRVTGAPPSGRLLFYR